jgi:ornithine cyclodeaminase/alanine dehydrogenase-like protein (mu-crystallin family)
MALIGNGAQAEFQALAFYHLLGIRELRLFDTDPAATAKLERNLALLQLPALRVTRCVRLPKRSGASTSSRPRRPTSATRRSCART